MGVKFIRTHFRVMENCKSLRDLEIAINCYDPGLSSASKPSNNDSYQVIDHRRDRQMDRSTHNDRSRSNNNLKVHAARGMYDEEDTLLLHSPSPSHSRRYQSSSNHPDQESEDTVYSYQEICTAMESLLVDDRAKAYTVVKKERKYSKGEWCDKCKDTHPFGCWKGILCDGCGGMGHPKEHCFKRCKGCSGFHNHGECEMNKEFNVLKLFSQDEANRAIISKLPESFQRYLNGRARQ